MRLHRLELEGFGPFRARQVVDFDAFDGDGIFLIAGRTGAGKSSVLDGICFALYGGVPRYDGGERRLRSDHCAAGDPSRVVVEFTAAGRRWRVTRSPEYDRPKQRGAGLTTEPHRALLEELDGGEWIGRAARPVDVARELDEILGLNKQQFLQVILLAQNRFAEFLLAKSDDRQQLLRRLFGTRTYEDYQGALERRRKEAERALAAAGDGVALLLDEAARIVEQAGVSVEAAGDGRAGEAAAPRDAASAAQDGASGGAADGDAVPPAGGEGAAAIGATARLAAAERGAQRLTYRVEALTHEHDAAESALVAAERLLVATRALRERQEQRVRSRAALAAREEQAAQIADDRRALELAIAAETLRAPIETAARAEREAAAALGAVAQHRERWSALDATRADVDAAALRIVADELTGGLAVWERAAEREDGLARRESAAADQRVALLEVGRSLDALDARRAALPGLLAALDAELVDARGAAASLGAAEQAAAAVAARLAAAHDAERLATALAGAEAAYLAAGAAHDDARAAVTVLLRRRLAGHAGELAAALVDGEPCAVCGAIEHPAPAPLRGEPVSDDEIVAAEARRDRAADDERRAGDVARAARAAHAEASARAGGEAVPALESARADADAAVTAATAAVTLRDRLDAERTALVDADAATEADRDRLIAERTDLGAALARAETEIDGDRTAIDEARAGFDTVRARVADGTSRRTHALALRDALVAADAAAERARTVALDLDERIAASAFADALDAAAALRPAPERTALDERVREHDVALRAERERLRELELDLAGEPEDLVDVADAEAAHVAARARWRGIVDAAAAAAETARRARDLVDRADVAHAGLAGLADEHAVVARLAHTVAGRAPNTHRMTLETFVLAAELEEIVASANLRLDAMSAGRYRLLHSDALAARGAASGLGIEIMDAHTGQPRPAQSLSGGETFLASLALALGLAEVVTARAGGVRLDTLFIDEGFGSLDEETLELAMRTLDELRQGGRTVGLISHVPAMKDRLPAQLVVAATPQGPSVIRQDAAGIAA